jgi:hypothetical protein
MTGLGSKADVDDRDVDPAAEIEPDLGVVPATP